MHKIMATFSNPKLNFNLLLFFLASITSYSSYAQNSMVLRVSILGNVQEVWVELDGGITAIVSPNGALTIQATDKLTADFNSSFESDPFHGKPIRIGNTKLEYYETFRGDEANGKLSKIGNTTIDYYRGIANTEFTGKVSRVGSIKFTYYRSFDGASRAGKISKIGNAAIDYLAGNGLVGKIATFGTFNFYYFMRADGEGREGKIKKVDGEMERVNVALIL